MIWGKGPKFYDNIHNSISHLFDMSCAINGNQRLVENEMDY